MPQDSPNTPACIGGAEAQHPLLPGLPTLLLTPTHSARKDNRTFRTRKMPSSARQEALGRNLGVACMSGNLDRVSRLLAAGAAKEIPTPVMGMMMTPLNAAAYTNNGRIVRVLIKAGANVNGRQSTGHTPLHCCAMEGQECMMKDLLQAGANPTLASVEGQTPLHTAAQWGHAREVKMLIAAGAKINARCQKGYTPLRLAAWKGTAAAVKALLDAGADVGVKDYMDCTIISSAFQNKDDEIIRLLLDAGADPDKTDPEGDSPPVMLAVNNNNAELVRSILAAGANANIAIPNGITPVALAAQLGHSRCLAVLLSCGGSPHHVVVRKNVPTPLQWAIISLNPTCLAFLLAAGANPAEQHKCSSSYFDSKLQESLGKNQRPSSPGAHVIRLLHVAEAFGARSWQWVKEQEGEGAGVEDPLERGGGLQGSTPTGPTARASWMAPRGGVFVPAVLRYVAKMD